MPRADSNCAADSAGSELAPTHEVVSPSGNVVLTREAISEKLTASTEFALKYFLAEKLEYPVGEFQKEVFPVLWKSTRDTALAIPRSFTKTTMAKIATVLALYFRDFRFAVYVRETMTSAIASCQDILRFFACPNWVNAYGPLEFVSQDKSEGLWIFRFPSTGKLVTLKAGSYKSSSRGDVINQDRPDFCVVDDLDQRDDSDAVRDAKSIWFWSTLKRGMKLHGSLMLYLANLTSDAGILQELLDDPDWNSYHYGCIKADGSALWPEMLPLNEIKRDYKRAEAKRQLYLWYQEMMNVPLP
ncbi:MAG: hypothetical protein L3J05_05845, partial [Robiginitomaculum sp.]|nr:hypothetical protein [Robiginitomaculum sp.]